MKYAEDGYVIQVGDIIEATSYIGKRRHEVMRVTPKRAYVQYNERVEGVFPRVYKSFGFGPIPRVQWSQTTHAVLIGEPAKESA
jgi:hypothetical protein